MSALSIVQSPVALSEVLARGDIWRGDALASLPGETIASGYAELDAELPGGGWPQGQLTEILLDQAGLGEMSLLLPALRRLSAAGGWLALVAPPCLPHAPAWAAAGIALERLLIVRANSQQTPWAIEQLLASGGFAGVLAWAPPRLDARALRRLQVASEGRPVFAVLWRSTVKAATPSPAPLRLSLNAGAGGELLVRLLKRRGRPASRPIVLNLPGRPAPRRSLQPPEAVTVAPGGHLQLVAGAV